MVALQPECAPLLQQDNSESQLRSLWADYDHLVLDYERLRRENEEMEIKLKEKKDLDEFEALERKAEKDQEVRDGHMNSNLFQGFYKHCPQKCVLLDLRDGSADPTQVLHVENSRFSPCLF